MPTTQSQLILYDEEHQLVLDVCEELARAARAKSVFVVDQSGQLLAQAGELRGIDTTSLATLTAGTVAATGGLAEVLGEQEFAIHFHQGHRDHLYLRSVAGHTVLVVVFDEQSSLGLVGLRVRQAGAELARIVETIRAKSGRSPSARVNPFAEMTPDEIESLFPD